MRLAAAKLGPRRPGAGPALVVLSCHELGANLCPICKLVQIGARAPLPAQGQRAAIQRPPVSRQAASASLPRPEKSCSRASCCRQPVGAKLQTFGTCVRAPKRLGAYKHDANQPTGGRAAPEQQARHFSSFRPSQGRRRLEALTPPPPSPPPPPPLATRQSGLVRRLASRRKSGPLTRGLS